MWGVGDDGQGMWESAKEAAGGGSQDRSTAPVKDARTLVAGAGRVRGSPTRDKARAAGGAQLQAVSDRRASVLPQELGESWRDFSRRVICSHVHFKRAGWLECGNLLGKVSETQALSGSRQ